MRPPALRQRPSSSWVLVFIILGVWLLLLLGRTATTTLGFRPAHTTNRPALSVVLRKSPYNSGRRYIILPDDHIQPRQLLFLAAKSQGGDDDDEDDVAVVVADTAAGPTTASAPKTTPRILADEDVPLIYDDDALTKNELVLRFQDVLAHYRITTTSQPELLSLETVRHNLLCRRLPNLQLDRCRVAPSTIPNAGMGVFSKRDIQAGELITLFPADALLVWKDEVGALRAGLTVRIGPHVVLRGAEDRDDDHDIVAAHFTSAEARRYELKIGPRESIVADVRITKRYDGPTSNNNDNNNAAYLAHMINDGADLLLLPDQHTVTAVTAEKEYEAASYRRHNAAICDVYGGCHYMAVATRDIAKDEEIFVSYGIGYWSSRLSKSLVETTTVSSLSEEGQRPKKPTPAFSRSKKPKRRSSSSNNNNKQPSNKKGFA